MYLEGALRRASEPKKPVFEVPKLEPAYKGPAPSPSARDKAVLDPFAVHARGEDRLRKRLGALSARHLQQIIRAYRLADEHKVELDDLSEAELVDLIVEGVEAAASRPGTVRPDTTP